MTKIGPVFVALLCACATPSQPSAPAAASNATAAATSEYGMSMDTAVEVCKPAGERAYIQRLRCPDGAAPTFNRTGSGSTRTAPQGKAAEEAMMEQMWRDGPLKPGEPDYHIVDYYEVQCGAQTTRIVMDMYHCHQDAPGRAVAGFTIVE